jgi:hypothetical protein
MERQKFDAEHTFVVEVKSGEGYVVDGKLKPTLYVKAGHEYLFDIDARGYPFYITKSPMGGEKESGVENGTMIFKCEPWMLDQVYYYQCSKVKEMGYKIICLEG